MLRIDRNCWSQKVIVKVIVFAVICVILTLMNGCAEGVDAPASSLPTSGLVLKVSPTSMKLDNLAKGQSTSAVAQVTNLSAKAIFVHKFVSSCPCVSVSPEAFAIPPKGYININFLVNLNEDSEFIGNLNVEIIGCEANDIIVLKTSVIVQVVPSASQKNKR